MYICNSMPTFLILKGTHVKETIRGANPTALRTAVLAAAADAAKGPAASAGAFFSGKGQTLGSASTPSAASSPAAFGQGSGLPQTVVRFLGLYFTTLFSTEPAAAAEASPFKVQKSGGGVRVGR
jgi:thioredoxin 1